MANPFYLQEVPVDAPFCNREKELKELRSYAEARANVVLFSPRRYGKTSLVKRIQRRLKDGGAIPIFADLFGIASVDDVAARLAKAVFAVTHQKESFWKAALRTIRSFRPVLKPDPEGGVSLSVEPSSVGRTGPRLLEETMESLGAFIKDTEGLIHVALDEFQEIVVLREAPQIEGIMRAQIQQQAASYFFIGSRRRILLGIFNDRQRPFFQSAINYPLEPLIPKELARFIESQFREGGRKCSLALAERMVSRVRSHPYYAEKLAFFLYAHSKTITEEVVQKEMERLISSERPVFEAIIQGLAPQQRLLMQALAVEPTQKVFSIPYIRRHGLGSLGGVQHSMRHLEGLDLIEREEERGLNRMVDPVLEIWLRKQGEERIP